MPSEANNGIRDLRLFCPPVPPTANHGWRTTNHDPYFMRGPALYGGPRRPRRTPFLVRKGGQAPFAHGVAVIVQQSGVRTALRSRDEGGMQSLVQQARHLSNLRR